MSQNLSPTFNPLYLHLHLNDWGMQGKWLVNTEHATLKQAGGSIVYRFQARDLNLVLGTQTGKPIRFIITIDGQAPSNTHGLDVNAQGEGVVQSHRLYQLVRHNTDKPVAEHTFEIKFLDAGLDAYAFTFG